MDGGNNSGAIVMDAVTDPPPNPTVARPGSDSGTGRAGTTVRLGQKFIDTLWSDARHKALFGGRGAAKSWSVATYLAIRTARKKKRVVCARQFQNSIRDSSKHLIEKRIDSLGLRPQYDINDRAITHANGSEYIFLGLERNIDSIRSIEDIDILWVEEARNTKAKSLEILLPTIRASTSELIWTWNPEQPDDPVDAYFRSGPLPPRTVVTRVDYRDNPFFYCTALPHEMEVLKRGNYERYKHVWLGEYDTRFETKVFPNVRIGRVDLPDYIRPRYGLDFGFGSDPSCIIKIYVDEVQKIIYIAAEAFGRVAMDDLPTILRSVLQNDSDFIRADSSQPGTIEFLNARGFNIEPARKGAGSVKTGILLLQGFDIVIDPDCEEMREEARLYSWMTDRLTGKVR